MRHDLMAAVHYKLPASPPQLPALPEPHAAGCLSMANWQIRDLTEYDPVALQILDALCVLRTSQIIHCDLKPENVLLKGQQGEIKVIDFGSACFENRTMYSYIQSRFYRSPEVCSKCCLVDLSSAPCDP